MEQFNEFVGNNFPLFLGLAVVLGLLAQNLWASFTNKAAVDPARLTELINREDALVVDVRAIADYEKGHIINAINIPSNGFKDQLHQLKNKEQPILSFVIAAPYPAASASYYVQTALKISTNLKAA